ncbi:MAG TPA: hypothetical protein VLE23_06955 [Geminicoccaceae bacterium]|nr:hypothetical protein [Geminicoccaceae bacterium]
MRSIGEVTGGTFDLVHAFERDAGALEAAMPLLRELVSDHGRG